MKELVIIGQGPAGISAALYAVRGGASVTVVAKDGGALAKADKIQNYYGFADGISAKELVANGIAQAKNLGAKFIEAEVCGVEFGTDGFDVKTTDRTIAAGALVIACGTSRNVPPIKNIDVFEGRGVSYCAICDGFFFRGKKIAVIGNGAYAESEYGVLKNIIEDVTILTNGLAPQFSLPCDTRKIESFEGGCLRFGGRVRTLQKTRTGNGRKQNRHRRKTRDEYSRHLCRGRLHTRFATDRQSRMRRHDRGDGSTQIFKDDRLTSPPG